MRPLTRRGINVFSCCNCWLFLSLKDKSRECWLLVIIIWLLMGITLLHRHRQIMLRHYLLWWVKYTFPTLGRRQRILDLSISCYEEEKFQGKVTSTVSLCPHLLPSSWQKFSCRGSMSPFRAQRPQNLPRRASPQAKCLQPPVIMAHPWGWRGL